MNFLRDLALSHQRHEGYGTSNAPTITNNNNPGALRWHKSQKAFGGEYRIDFTWFPSYERGFEALKADIKAKITGASAYIDYSNNPTFLDYVKVYAPEEDSNDPSSYVQALIRSLPDYNLKPNTPLTVLAGYISGVKPVESIALRSNYKRALRAFMRAVGAIKRMIGRRLTRLRK